MEPSVNEVETKNEKCQDNTETKVPNFHNYGLQSSKTIEVSPNGNNTDVCKSVIFKFGESYMCPECQNTFLYLSNLKRHVQRKHPVLMPTLFPLCKIKVPGSPKKDLQSPENSEQPTNQSNLLLSKSTLNSEKTYVCPQCPKAIFYKRYNYKRHIKIKHPSLFLSMFPSNTSVCNMCSKSFKSTRELQLHRNTYHEAHCAMTKHKCPLCPQMFIRTKFNEHFEKSHNLILKPIKLNFISYEEFSDWKKAIERVTKSYFIKNHSKKLQRNGVTREGFICHRSGSFKSEGYMNKRKLKAQGSKKINAFCPAIMKVIIEKDGTCQLIFQNQHIGHDNELHHLNLTVEEKKYVADKLASHLELPIGELLSIIHKYAAEDGAERLCVLNKKDLYNIRANFLKDNQFYLSAPKLNEKLTKDLRDIHNKHTESEHIHADISKIEKGWVLTLSDSNEIYLIKEILNSCNCTLLCIYCRVCIDRYSCTCSDSSIDGNMCKHIHFFCTERSKMRDDHSEFLDLNSDVEENSSNSAQCTPQCSPQKNNNMQELSEISDKDNATYSSINSEKISALKKEFSSIVDCITTEEEYKLSENALQDLALKLKSVKNQTIPIEEAVITAATHVEETVLVNETSHDHLYSSPVINKVKKPNQNSNSLKSKYKEIRPKLNLTDPVNRTLILEMRNVRQGAKICCINFAKPDKK